MPKPKTEQKRRNRRAEAKVPQNHWQVLQSKNDLRYTAQLPALVDWIVQNDFRISAASLNAKLTEISREQRRSGIRIIKANERSEIHDELQNSGILYHEEATQSQLQKYAELASEDDLPGLETFNPSVRDNHVSDAKSSIRDKLFQENMRRANRENDEASAKEAIQKEDSLRKQRASAARKPRELEASQADPSNASSAAEKVAKDAAFWYHNILEFINNRTDGSQETLRADLISHFRATVEALGLDKSGTQEFLDSIVTEVIAAEEGMQAPEPPSVAPELYVERKDETESAAAFMTRVYGRWAGTSLTRRKIGDLDPTLVRTLYREDIPPEIDKLFPKSSGGRPKKKRSPGEEEEALEKKRAAGRERARKHRERQRNPQ